MNNLDLALIGNGSYGALINKQADIVWCCMPRFDSQPIFNTLLQDNPEDPDGIYSISLIDLDHGEQYYLRNDAVLLTRLYDNHGGVIEITDFAPRFKQHGRMFHPITLVRLIKPLQGNPRIRIKLRPSDEFGGKKPSITFGSNHIRYIFKDLVLRLTTDLSITAIMEESIFVLENEYALLLGPDETVTDSVVAVGRAFLEQTSNYWNDWVRHLSIPFEWQGSVIRAAITLKLNAYEDTGAIIAAMTTSIPEHADSQRNWDYRFCWLRDAYFVINALNRLGKAKTMERYLSYIINIVANAADQQLQPVYRINGQTKIEELNITTLPGYRGINTVREGNDAYKQVQNDIYGSVVLAAAHGFFDHRLEPSSNSALFKTLEKMGEKAYDVYEKPDAGIWELRSAMLVHTFSSVMCWAACDRLAKIARRLDLPDRSTFWQNRADEMHKTISKKAWNQEKNCFVDSFAGEELDASLLLLHELGFLKEDDPRFAATVNAIEKQLLHGKFVFRYVKEDDFGRPENAFTICTFWYINALAALNRIDEARQLFEELLSCCNSHGLLSEDINPKTKELWGNFPQTYSMVGLINSAMRLSKNWEDAF